MKKKKIPTVRVEPKTFGSVVSALPIKLLGNISNLEFLINIKIENMLYGLWEISPTISASLRVHNIFHFVR